MGPNVVEIRMRRVASEGVDLALKLLSLLLLKPAKDRLEFLVNELR